MSAMSYVKTLGCSELWRKKLVTGLCHRLTFRRSFIPGLYEYSWRGDVKHIIINQAKYRHAQQMSSWTGFGRPNDDLHMSTATFPSTSCSGYSSGCRRHALSTRLPEDPFRHSRPLNHTPSSSNSTWPDKSRRVTSQHDTTRLFPVPKCMG